MCETTLRLYDLVGPAAAHARCREVSQEKSSNLCPKIERRRSAHCTHSTQLTPHKEPCTKIARAGGSVLLFTHLTVEVSVFIYLFNKGAHVSNRCCTLCLSPPPFHPRNPYPSSTVYEIRVTLPFPLTASTLTAPTAEHARGGLWRRDGRECAPPPASGGLAPSCLRRASLRTGRPCLPPRPHAPTPCPKAPGRTGWCWASSSRPAPSRPPSAPSKAPPAR